VKEPWAWVPWRGRLAIGDPLHAAKLVEQRLLGRGLHMPRLARSEWCLNERRINELNHLFKVLHAERFMAGGEQYSVPVSNSALSTRVWT